MKLARLHRGFSLAEMMISLALIALMGALAVLNMRTGLTGADTRALAMVVAEELKSTRQLAIATQEPVALVLPSNGGTLSAAQSLYQVRGLSMGRVAKVLYFAREHPGSLVYQGLWNTSGGTFSTFPALSAQRFSLVNVNQWLTNSNIIGYDMRQDYAMVFNPDGSVASNGLPFFQGAYHWIVAAGASTTAAAIPASQTAGLTSGLNYSSATSLGKPWCISVTPNGQVGLQSGLPDASAGLEVSHSLGISGVSTPPAITLMPVANPVANSLQIAPATTLTLPSGVNATVAPGQRLTLVVDASDSSGRNLFGEWSCNPGGSNSSPAKGAFSYPSQQRLSWNLSSQTWQSRWDWMAPPNAQPGDRYTFECKLGDGLTALVLPATQTIQAISKEKVYTVVQQTHNGVFGEYLIRNNIDGSNPTYMGDVLPFSGWGMTQDGSKVLVGQGAGYAVFSGQTGKKLFSVNPPSYYYGDPASISPQGDKVAYWHSTAGLMVANLDGTGAVNVMPGTPYAVSQGITWSPDGTQLAALANFGKITLVNKDGTNRRNILGSQWYSSARWSANGQSLWVCNSSGVGGKYDPCRFDLASGTLANSGNPLTNLQTTSGSFFNPYHFGVSIDGSSLYASSGGFLWRVPVDGTTPTKLCVCPVGGGSVRGIWVAQN